MRKQIIHIRLLPLLFAASGFLVSCGESLEDRAAREAKEFTEKFCPTPVQNDESTDSLTFDKHTKTYTYYRTLSGPADNAPVINANRAKLVATLLEALKNDPGSKKYKEADFNFHFVYRSKSSGNILFETTLGNKDYQ